MSYNRQRMAVVTANPLFSPGRDVIPETHGEMLLRHVCSELGHGPLALPAYRGPQETGQSIFALIGVGLSRPEAIVLACAMGKPGFQPNLYIAQSVPPQLRAAVRRAMRIGDSQP
jgi:hypothetical protein